MAKKKNILVKTDPNTKDGFLDLEDFSDLVDTSKVVYYSINPVINLANDKTEALSIEFFDENKNKLPLKEA